MYWAGLWNPMNLGSNSEPWTSHLISLSHDFLLFETISEIYESSEWRIVGLLYWFGISLTTFSTVVPQELGFSKTFLKQSWKLRNQQDISHEAFLPLPHHVPMPVLSPFQALLGKAQAIYLTAQTSRFALLRACKNKLGGSSGFSKDKAASVILENISGKITHLTNSCFCVIPNQPLDSCLLKFVQSALCKHWSGSTSLCWTNVPNRPKKSNKFFRTTRSYFTAVGLNWACGQCVGRTPGLHH